MSPVLTLIIAVYNNVHYLEFILAALQRQTFLQFEVVIADDGSGPEIAGLVEQMRAEVSFPLRHVWQEDIGFRKNAILNKAVMDAQTDYVVFIDGDCVPHRRFLEDHWLNREKGAVLCGRRINLSKQMTDRQTLESIRAGKFEKLSLSLLFDGMMARSSYLEGAIRIQSAFLRRLLRGNTVRILGCNFSVEKSLLEKINGFNEEYRAPGLGEDSDIAFRLGLVGARFKNLKYLAVLYHLYHPITKVGEENKRLYHETVRLRNPYCANGMLKTSEAELKHS